MPDFGRSEEAGRGGVDGRMAGAGRGCETSAEDWLRRNEIPGEALILSARGGLFSPHGAWKSETHLHLDTSHGQEEVFLLDVSFLHQVGGWTESPGGVQLKISARR